MRKLNLKELNRLSTKEFKTIEKYPIVIILDNVRSALNVGSAFRTSDAFALSHLYLCGITATPPHREILKTAIGATASVDLTHFNEVKDAVLHCKEQGYTILGAEQTDSSVLLQDFKVEKNAKYAIVMGNEVKGISDEILELLDYCLEIPQFGTKHSFNVSVATGIITWDVFNKMNYTK
jgi:23S rRNA (guanosine2251-2'-O)-methyltransferase